MPGMCKELMMEEAIGKALPISENLELTDEVRSRIPKFISHANNVDHWHGNGKAVVVPTKGSAFAVTGEGLTSRLSH